MMITTTDYFWISLLLLTVQHEQHTTADAAATANATVTAATKATDTVTAASTEMELDQLWPHWKRTHNKQYADRTEETQRRQQWMEHAIEVMHHNVKYDLGLVSYSKGLNQFADLSWQEFRSQHLSGLLSNRSIERSSENKSGGAPFNSSEVTNVADHVDWRQYGLVRQVKNQGSCGSCWAFSTTGAIEGQYAKQYGKPLEFSEQQLVDCSKSFGNHGCNGGLMEEAFEYLERFGLEPEQVYPYHAVEQQCHFYPSLTTVKVKSYSTMHTGSEQTLKSLVGTRGPVSVGVDVDAGFQMYRHGIYRSTECSSSQLNHGVLVVGYGTEHGVPYWIIKNSWSVNWGEDGYIRLARDHGNMCGVATMASVPELE